MDSREISQDQEITTLRDKDGQALDKALLKKIESMVTLLKEVESSFLPATFLSSFSAEDMVILDAAVKYTPSIVIVTLDTGRLPEETYLMMQRVREYYGISLNIYYPDPKELEPFLNQYGPNAFYESSLLRKACCEIRKILPLMRALKDKKAWVTGIRRQQSLDRQETPISFFDQELNIHKFNPLVEWSHEEVWKYLHHFKVPYHPLHDRNYPSIGCAPCTRPIQPGEDIRAGRWWWENTDTKKECGIHCVKLTASGSSISETIE